jgi:hypothetical protein
MEGLLLWLGISVAMLVIYRIRPPARPWRPLVALALAIYAVGAMVLVAGIVGALVATVSGAGPLALVFALLSAPVVWWLTAGFAARCGVPPQALLHREPHDQPPQAPSS